MPIEIRLPGLGESIAEGTIVTWLKQPGDFVARDEAFVTVSTDDVTFKSALVIAMYAPSLVFAEANTCALSPSLSIRFSATASTVKR